MNLNSLIFLNLCVLITTQAQNPTVTTKLGKIIGSILQTRLNNTIYAFRGIKYAKAPTGDLRFKPPEAITENYGIFNASVDGPVCPQPSDDPTSEDCLTLNVYTTQLPDVSQNLTKRPVIIYIHAGGFYSVTGRSDWAGPQYFLDQEIVLVTINYRLGSLGFLSTGKDVPGNNGLKDQVLAFKWVRDNIEFFGGDQNSVTLFGYSAGAWSISLHLVSPMSRGLFHKVILGSGSALGQWVLPTNQLDLAKKQARLVGCPDNVEVGIMVQCLKSIPAEVLGNSLGEFKEFVYDPVIIWYPVIEENFGQDRFLAEDPVKMIERGDFAQVPVIAGVTKDEFGYRAYNLVSNETILNLLSTNFETYAPIAFLYERESDKSKEMSAAVRQFYLSSDPLTNSSFSGLANAYADSIIGFSVNRFVNLVSEKNSENVYYYEFTYQGRFSHFYLPDNATQPYGVVHHDDLIYLFYVSPLFPFFTENYPEREMVEKLTSLWASFAQNGEPIPKSSQIFEGINWEPYNKSSRKYLEIGKRIILRERLFEERYNFWDNLLIITKT